MVMSTRSPRVRTARSLAKRALRERSRLFLAEGPQAVREALGRDGLVRELFVTAAARSRHADLVAAAPRLVVVLANIRDPGNAGTVLRTADAAGAHGVIFAGASVDPYNSKCVRSSAGSLFHLPLVLGVQVSDAVTALRGAGLGVLAADGSASLGLDDLDRVGRLGRPTAWLFGNEAWGLPGDLVALADDAVAVPIYGQAESLNLAAAAAVCLYASARAQYGGAAQSRRRARL